MSYKIVSKKIGGREPYRYLLVKNPDPPPTWLYIGPVDRLETWLKAADYFGYHLAEKIRDAEHSFIEEAVDSVSANVGYFELDRMKYRIEIAKHLIKRLRFYSLILIKPKKELEIDLFLKKLKKNLKKRIDPDNPKRRSGKYVKHTIAVTGDTPKEEIIKKLIEEEENNTYIEAKLLPGNRIKLPEGVCEALRLREGDKIVFHIIKHGEVYMFKGDD